MKNIFKNKDNVVHLSNHIILWINIFLIFLIAYKNPPIFSFLTNTVQGIILVVTVIAVFLTGKKTLDLKYSPEIFLSPLALGFNIFLLIVFSVIIYITINPSRQQLIVQIKLKNVEWFDKQIPINGDVLLYSEPDSFIAKQTIKDGIVRFDFNKSEAKVYYLKPILENKFNRIQCESRWNLQSQLPPEVTFYIKPIVSSYTVNLPNSVSIVELEDCTGFGALKKTNTLKQVHCQLA